MIGLFINCTRIFARMWQYKVVKVMVGLFSAGFALMIAIVAMAMLTGCASKQFSRGEFGDTNEVNLLNDKFGESTAEVLSKSVVDQLKKCDKLDPRKPLPFVAIEGVANRTEEMIDLMMVSNEIKTSLIRSGKFRFVDKASRQALENEIQFNESGSVSGGSKKSRGNQIGADLMLVGELFLIAQEAGKDKSMFYRLDVQLTNVETGVIDCIGSEKVRTVYRKRRE
jgi:uncharacterized protein (TIGR02722 family)